MRCAPSTRSVLIVRTGAGATTGVAVVCGAAPAGATCAMTGTPDSIVPASSMAPARTVFIPVIAVTKPTPEKSNRPLSFSRPAPSASPDQASDILPEPQIAQIVERHEEHQGQDCEQTAAKRPFLSHRLQGTPSHRF